jgi:hypothetical protein
MSYSPNPKEGYTKMVNIKQDGGQHVEVYIPDTRRRRSPEAEARALARSEIKEQYKAAALAEEVKAIKKQRNKLVDNLAKVGRSPSFIADIPSASGLSGTPKAYVDTPTSSTTTPSSTTSKSTSQLGNLNYQTGNLNYSAPIGPLPSSSMGGFKNKPYDNRINYSQPIGPTQGPGLGMSFNRNRNYSAPIGPLPSSSMGGFQDRPYNPQMNYSQPIGPTQGPGLGMSFNRNRNYSAPIGPAPSSSMGGFQGRPFNQQTNYSQPIGPTQGPGLGMSFNRNRNYSAPIGPAPSSSMGGFQGRPFNQQTNYSQPIGPTQGPGLGMSFNRNRNYSAPIGPVPGPDMGGYQDRPYDRQINYSQPIGPRGAPNNRRSSGRPSSSSGRMVEYQDEPITDGNGRGEIYDEPHTSGQTSQISGKLVPHSGGGSQGSISQQDTSKWTPEMLLPGKTLAEVEAVYKQRKASAIKKGRKKLARSLDRAIVIRRKQFGASPGKPFQASPGRTPDSSPTGKTPLPTDVEKNAELLLPGKTEQAVRRVHAERRAAALKKGNKELVARLDRALPVRLQRLKSQGANVFKVSPERLLPGKTLAEVEAAYKQRRAAAGAKGRTSLVKALDRAIVERRKQFGASPGKTPQTTPIKSPTGKTPTPTTPERNAEYLLPGKTEQAVRKVHAERRAAAVKKGNKELVARLDRALLVRLQRLKSQGANVFKIAPFRLIPGDTLPEVEKAYKQRRAAAVAKGRTALVQALDRAIIIQRKQIGEFEKEQARLAAEDERRTKDMKSRGSWPGKSPERPFNPDINYKKPIGPMPLNPEKNAERLLPGKTEQAVRKVHAERRAAAVKKGNKELVARLDRALPVRLQRLKSQEANVFKISPERLLPGKTLPEVEAAYKQRRASAVAKGRTALVEALDRAIVERRKRFGGSSGKVPQSSDKEFSPERLLPGKTLAEVEATYKKRRDSAVAKGRTTLVQALDRAIGIRRKQLAGSPGKVPQSPGKTPLPSGKEWKDVFGPVDMSNPNPRAVSEKYQSLRKKTKDEDVSKLNALFQKAIADIKLIKRQRAAQESKSTEATKAKVEAEKTKAKSAEIKKSIDREIISTKRKIRDVSIKAKKASANIDRAGKEMSAASVRRDTRKVEKLTRFSRKRQQNLRSAQEVRGKLITSLKGLEQKSAKVSPLMLTQGSPNPMARQSAPQQSVQQQKSSQIQAKAQSFLAEKARAQSSQIQAKSQKFLAEKAKSVAAQTEKQLVSKAQSAKLDQEKRQKSAKMEQEKRQQSAKAQSVKLEQEKKQQLAKAQSAKAQSAKAQSVKLEQAKKQQMAKAQSAKAEQAKRLQIERARTSQKRQMSQVRPQKTMLGPKRR